MTKKRVYLFIILVIGLGYFTFSLIPILGLTYGEPSSIIILTVGMFTPTISSLLVRLITNEGFEQLYLKPNLRKNLKFYVGIYFIPTLLVLLSGLLFFLIFPENFDSEFTFLKASAPNQNVMTLLILSIAQIIVVGPIINIIPTLGEEIGWRAYLLPKLQELVGKQKAIVISALVWGLWHAPVIIMGHNYPKGYFGYPYLGILVMVLFCLMLSVLESYTFFKTESVIGAAMIHSTINASAALPIIVSKGSINPLLGPAITGLFGAIPFIIVAIILFVRIGKKPI